MGTNNWLDIFDGSSCIEDVAAGFEVDSTVLLLCITVGGSSAEGMWVVWLLPSAAVDGCDSFDGTFVTVVVAAVDDDVAFVETI